jgi:hypothetical protein
VTGATRSRSNNCGAMATKDVRLQIQDAVTGWEGVSVRPHRYGGIEFRLGKRELGHLHGDRLLDIPFSRPVRDEMVHAGRVQKHHILPESGWVSFIISVASDVDEAISLLRRSFELAVEQGSRGKERRWIPE